jgi:cyanophycin synthetase
MIAAFDQPNKEIDPKEFLGYGGWYLYLILKEAQKRGIDCQILSPTKESSEQALYIRLKKGEEYRWISPQRGFFNSKLACELALSKYLTYQILQSINLPIPRFAKINELTQLNQLKIPSPWVIKPITQTQGKGVLVGLKNITELKRACSVLLKKYSHLIVEQFIAGQDFRLLILENKLLGAVRRIPPQIKGDGLRTIQQLIEKDNQEKRKGRAKDFKPFLKKIKIDLELKRCLAQQGLKLSSVLKKNQIIPVRQNANFSSGGEVAEVTNKVHPENIKIAQTAVKALGLKLGGVDIITKDISQPITKNKGKIIEINGAPSLWIHHYPNYGLGRNAAGQIIDYLFRT